MAHYQRENRRPLTEQELEMEAENLWANEEEPDTVNDIFGDSSDEDENYVPEQQSDTDNEQTEDDDEEQRDPSTSQRNVASILGKNGHRWTTQAPARQGRPRRENIVLHLPGPKQEARNVRSPLESWNLLFSEEILDIIVMHTNQEILRKCQSGLPQSYKKTTNTTEVKAFIGLLYLAGALRVSNCNLDELWSTAIRRQRTISGNYVAAKVPVYSCLLKV